MADITAKFQQRALLVLQYVVDEEISKVRYHVRLRDDIREVVSFPGCKILNDMIARDRECEIDLEHIGKSKR